MEGKQMYTCPHCNQLIEYGENPCHHCRQEIGWDNSTTNTQKEQNLTSEEVKETTKKTGKPWKKIIALFIFCYIIYSCFLAGNGTPQEYFEEHDLKGIYRVHGEPDVKKIDDWIEMARNFGLKVPPVEYPVTPETVAELSRIAASSKHADLLGSLLIRSMMRAEYTTENQGHFGLASSAYTHFTSPIRRYPDLLVHRALLAGLKLGSISEPLEELKELATHCSKRERVAQDAEIQIPETEFSTKSFRLTLNGESVDCLKITFASRPERDTECQVGDVSFTLAGARPAIEIVSGKREDITSPLQLPVCSGVIRLSAESFPNPVSRQVPPDSSGSIPGRTLWRSAHHGP